MRECPLPVLMLSTLTTSDADTTLAALEKGAVDVVSKPAGLTHMNMPTISGELIGKVRAAAAVDVTTLARTDEPGVAAEGLAAAPPATPLEAVVIGASTGGPPAVGMLLSVLPRDFPAPVLVIQHMPVGFTSALAERTARTSALPVAEASDGDIFEPGRLFIARSGQHVRFQRRRSRVSLRLDRRPGGTTHTPSIDVTMASAAEVFGERAMGILLTGMGDDGARGLLAMREAGAYTVAEAESSSVVWGMPRVAAEIGAAETVADLTEIPSLLLRRGGFG
jgi:two-component system chemotaxis response regulator CheB